MSTISIDKCKSDKVIDIENAAFTNLSVRKISRTEEEYAGITILPNDIHGFGVIIIKQILN